MGAATTPPKMAPLGSSTMTVMARTGLSAGIMPMNRALNLLWEYARPITFWAVPVLPATVNPGGAASLAVPPVWVTVSIMAIIWLAVC